MANEYNPDALLGGMMGAAKSSPAPKSVTPLNGVAKEAGQLNENSTISLAGKSDKMPEVDPIPASWYDVSIDNMVIQYASTGRMGLNFTLAVKNPPYDKRKVFFTIYPDTSYGEPQFVQLMSRALTTDVKGDTVNLLEKAGDISYKDLADSGICINAELRVRTVIKPKKTKEGLPNGYKSEVADIALPKTSSYM